MTFDPEPMSGWDDQIDAPDPTVQELTGAVETLLRALHTFTKSVAHYERTDQPEVVQAYRMAIEAMSKIDWYAMNFAQNALDSGEDIFSCYPNNDVLVRYTPQKGRPSDPDQAELAF